jgi:leader peptidase (prepilin peptidase)/N-methyltransferase
VAVPEWIWYIFVFAFGCCIGSFLNVVIYRLPRDKSLVSPPSACPACGRHIRFYDNIPLVSWLVLVRKCRYCKASISPRYFIVELLTGSGFLGLFVLYFHFDLRDGLEPFSAGGWFVYLLHIIMLGSFIAASAIDLEHWIIPLSICWFVTAAGFIGSAVGVYVIDPAVIREYSVLPSASADTGALAAGAAAGLAVSVLLIVSGVLKRSYEPQNSEDTAVSIREDADEANGSGEGPGEPEEEQFNHRIEALKEIVFLLPIIIFSAAALWMVREVASIGTWWQNLLQHSAVAGLLGSIWGYFVGCGIVWGIRILGTLAFGKEAMGLGDVHLMGAAGAVAGPVYVVVAFFVAPFFGLAWAGSQMFFKKIRQIPYGPFLSLGIFIVIILHDWIRDYMSFLFYH